MDLSALSTREGCVGGVWGCAPSSIVVAGCCQVNTTLLTRPFTRQRLRATKWNTAEANLTITWVMQWHSTGRHQLGLRQFHKSVGKVRWLSGYLKKTSRNSVLPLKLLYKHGGATEWTWHLQYVHTKAHSKVTQSTVLSSGDCALIKVMNIIFNTLYL